jgi:RNA polymerase sigma-70 factor (ECF subfamily)
MATTGQSMNSAPPRVGISAEPRPESAEAQLVRQIVTGRNELFGELLQPHMIVLTRFVATKLQHDAEVDDVIQQTLMKAFAKLHQFRFEASFRTWLIRIAFNEVLRWHRDRSRSRAMFVGQLGEMQPELADKGASPLSQCESNESYGHLHTIIAKLPAKYRAVVTLRDLQGFTAAEAAQTLRLNVEGVRTRHWRARRRMATLLRSRMMELRKAG